MHIVLPKSDRLKAVNCSINSNLYFFNAVDSNIVDSNHSIDISYTSKFADTFVDKAVDIIADIPPRISLGVENGVTSGDDLCVVLTARAPKNSDGSLFNLYAGIRQSTIQSYAAFAHSDSNSPEYDEWFCILKAKAVPFTISIAVDHGNAYAGTVSLSSLGVYSTASWKRMQEAALLQMYQRHVSDTDDPEIRYVDSSLQREITHVADPTRSDSATTKSYVDTKLAMKANASDIAQIRISNMVDIRLMGCKPDDTSIDNANLISTFLSAHPKTGIYVPDGDWYIKTTLELGESEIYCDGALCAASDSAFDDFMVKVGVNLTAVDSTRDVLVFPRGKHIKVKVDGKFQNVNGISFQGFFASTLEFIAVGCMGICVQQLNRSVECQIYVMFYGHDDAHWANIGFSILHGGNDNSYRVIGRNIKIGIDIAATYLFFSYIHIWACELAVRITSGARICIGDFYPDYCRTAIGMDVAQPTTEKTTVSINNVLGILPDSWLGGPCRFLGSDKNLFKVQIKNYMNYYNTFYSYGVEPNTSVPRLYELGTVPSVIVSENDMNTFTTLKEFMDKYGLISSSTLLSSVKVQFEPYTQTDVAFTDSQYYKNMTLLGYKHADITYYIGTAYITVERIGGLNVYGNTHAIGGIMMSLNGVPYILVDDSGIYRKLTTSDIVTVK